MTTRVIVVDDQAMVRAGFAALLDAQEDIDVVGQAADGDEGVALARRSRPDVVLMDVRMPKLDGLEATRRIVASPGLADHTRVLMLTTFDVDDYVYEALRAGASGFLLKDAPPADLISAVHVVAAGDALLAPSITRRLIADFAQRRPAGRSKPSLRLNALTERETEVLTLVARGSSNSEIAHQLFVAEQTVKTHVSRVFTKLDLRDRAQAVVFAYESGLVTPGE
ncbi:response regulator [Flexivirga sp. B27]